MGIISRNYISEIRTKIGEEELSKLDKMEKRGYGILNLLEYEIWFMLIYVKLTKASLKPNVFREQD